MINRLKSVLPISVIAAIVLASVLPSILANSAAYAMGSPPTTCTNSYPSEITYMRITVGHKNYYPLINKNLTFTADLNQGYDVTMHLKVANTSNSENKNVGSIWYHQDAVGYASGRCVDNIKPDQTITIKNHFTGQPSWIGNDNRLISWETLGKTTPTNPYVFVSGATYRVHWVNFDSTATTTTNLDLSSFPSLFMSKANNDMTILISLLQLQV